jgi:hypothetical protein
VHLSEFRIRAFERTNIGVLLRSQPFLKAMTAEGVKTDAALSWVVEQISAD